MAIITWIGTTGDFNTGANWSGGSAPTTGDTIILNGTSNVALTSNLNQSASTGVTLIITHASSAQIGTDVDGVATYLQIGASNVIIGRSDGGTGNGSQLILLDLGSTASAVNILQSSSTSANQKYPPIGIKGTAVTLTPSGGTTGVAVRPGETATLAALKTTRGGNSTPTIYLGSGVTPTAISVDAGTVNSLSDNTCASARVSGGTYNVSGTGAHTLLNVDDGTCNYTGVGTITAANIRGSLLMGADARAKTITDATIYKNATLDIDNGVPGSITFTNPIQYPDGIGAVTIRTPAGVKGTLAAI